MPSKLSQYYILGNGRLKLEGIRDATLDILKGTRNFSFVEIELLYFAALL